jgi:hypothetical protein
MCKALGLSTTKKNARRKGRREGKREGRKGERRGKEGERKKGRKEKREGGRGGRSVVHSMVPPKALTEFSWRVVTFLHVCGSGFEPRALLMLHLLSAIELHRSLKCGSWFPFREN